jgi:hypothetical protein
MLLAEKAFPDDAVKMKRDKGVASSLDRCSVFETRDDMAE